MKTKLMRKDTQKIRVLGEEDGRVLMIDCVKPTMPKWIRQEEIEEYVLVAEGRIDESRLCRKITNNMVK